MSSATRRRRRAPALQGMVTDVDGTLTDAGRRLDFRAVAALRDLEDRGIPVVLATGNVLPIALAIHRSIGLSGPIVAENGGLLYRRVGGVDRITRLADRAVALRAYRKLKRDGLDVRRLFTDRWRETEVGLEPTISERVLRSHLVGYPVDVEGTGFAVHLMERGHGKVPGVQRALRSVGLDLDKCFVAGDGDNDVAMLEAAGFGVSFREASPRARAAADYVARARNAAGFVEAVKRARWLARPRGTPRSR